MALRAITRVHTLRNLLRGGGASVLNSEAYLVVAAASSSSPLIAPQGQHFRAVHRGPNSRKAASAISEPLAVDSVVAGVVSPILKSAYQLAEGRNQRQQLLVVELVNGQRFEFPLVWLRDNCRCSECFHPGSHSRILNWELFDVDGVELKECAVLGDGSRVQIVWSDGHRSEFTGEWLVERNFTQENCSEYLEEWYRPAPRLWGKKEFGENLKIFEFRDVINEDEALRGWIEALIRYGIVMIKNTPLTEQECRRLADRVGFIRKTHYGEEFIVKAKEGTSNVAYLSTPLQMHTDLPYYDYKPGCNLLHCLVQSKSQGGQNLIADAFYVADLMRREHPEDFAILSETLINWTDIGEDEGGRFHSIYRAPVICVGRDGKLVRINHSVPQRDSFFNVPLDRVQPWYRAMARFVKLIHQEAVEFKTAPGDILTFSNVRMVHGRTGYIDTEVNTRHIVGAYLDWDEIYSKMRVLKGFDAAKKSNVKLN